MNDHTILIGLNDFLLTYEFLADQDAGAARSGEVVVGLIEAANIAVEQKLNTCCLVLPQEQCVDEHLFKLDARLEFNVKKDARGLTIDYEGLVDEE